MGGAARGRAGGRWPRAGRRRALEVGRRWMPAPAIISLPRARDASMLGTKHGNMVQCNDAKRLWPRRNVCGRASLPRLTQFGAGCEKHTMRKGDRLEWQHIYKLQSEKFDAIMMLATSAMVHGGGNRKRQELTLFINSRTSRSSIKSTVSPICTLPLKSAGPPFATHVTTAPWTACADDHHALNGLWLSCSRV